MHFACTVIEDYIKQLNFSSKQVLQITAILKQKVSKQNEN